MKKLLFLATLMASFVLSTACVKADPALGVIIVPKQQVSTTLQNPTTQVGASLRVFHVGPVTLSGVALVNDSLGIKYGAVAGVHVFSNTELGAGYTYNFKGNQFSKPFLALTVRL